MTIEMFYMIIACLIVIQIWLISLSIVVITQEIKIIQLQRNMFEDD